MKQKIIISIISIVLLFGIILPSKTLAVTSSGGYEIEAYNINMVVNENNTFDITETIDANFTGYNKHGIFRKIPLKNTIKRSDGSQTKNRAVITNISVDDNFTTYNEGTYKVIKIGSASSTVVGKKSYTIKYTYDIGKDPLKDADELFFNLIGQEWDVDINNVSFTITMPKSFDKTELAFGRGYGESTNSNVTYTVDDKIINGFLESPLNSGEALTVRLKLPEGYFVRETTYFDSWTLTAMAISLSFVIIAYFMWRKYGKDEMVVDTVEFYPPEGFNSAEIAYLYKGQSHSKDVISLLVYLANKGYLKIQEFGDNTKKIFKSENFEIVKLKEYDGDNETESMFFNGLFKTTKFKDKVFKSDLDDCFYLTLNKITKNINKKENREKIYEKASLSKRIILMAMLLIVFIMMIGVPFVKSGQTITFLIVLPFFISFLIVPLAMLCAKPNVGIVISNSIILAMIGFMAIFTFDSLIEIDVALMIQFMVQIFCIIMLIIFFAVIKKRTPYGTEMLGKIQGFKNFLEMAEKPALEELVMQDPEYFYNILPYTYVLGVSDKWMEKFEDIAVEPPTWYGSNTVYSTHSFNHFMNSMYLSVSNAMTSSPSSSGGGSSGGFSSGGGSGGGGGGSW